MIKINCFCGQAIEVNDGADGQHFNCPSCGTELTVPDIEKKTQKVEVEIKPPIIPTQTKYIKPAYCGSCESTNLKKVSFVWEQQKTFSQSTLTGGTVGYSQGGGLGIGVFGGNLNGESNTLLEARLRPPFCPLYKKPSYRGTAFLCFILSFLLLLFISIPFTTVATALLPIFQLYSIFCFFIPCILRHKNFQKNEEKRQQFYQPYILKMKEWENSWICMDCGKLWAIKKNWKA